jgi:hypothetical protein
MLRKGKATREDAPPAAAAERRVCAPAAAGRQAGESYAEPPILSRRWSLVLALALARGTAESPTHSVLFIGNSLTYVNDLPTMVRRVAAAAGGDLRADLAAGPDMAVIDHTVAGSDAIRKIQGSQWDTVVLQQGPTPAGLCRDTLVIAAMRLAPAIRRAGARPAVFLSWTRQSYTGPMDEVAESAAQAARAVGGVVIPIGIAWRKALAADPTLPLYAPDGYHPAPAGTLLAALTIYDRLVGTDVTTIAPEALQPLAGLTLKQLGTLAAAAHAASREWPADPADPTPADTMKLSPTGAPC